MIKTKLFTFFGIFLLTLSLGACNENTSNSEESENEQDYSESLESSNSDTSAEIEEDTSNKWEYGTPKEVLDAIGVDSNYFLRFEYIEQKATQWIFYSDYKSSEYDADELRQSYATSDKQMMDAYFSEDAILLVYYSYDGNEYSINQYQLLANNPYNNGSSLYYVWYYEPNGESSSWNLSTTGNKRWQSDYWSLVDCSTFGIADQFVYQESGKRNGYTYDAYTLNNVTIINQSIYYYYLMLAGGQFIWGNDFYLYYDSLSQNNLTYIFPYLQQMMIEFYYEGFTYNAVGDDGNPASDDTLLYLTSRVADITISNLGETDLTDVVNGAVNSVVG